jgi:hypothetical protein
MNRKLLILPATIVLSSFLFVGCTSNDADNSQPTPSATSTELKEGDVDPDAPAPAPALVPVDGLDENYLNYYHEFYTLPASNFEYYKTLGATTFVEDPAERTIGPKEWAANQDKLNYADRVLGEVTSDNEQSAIRISEYLKTKPNATLDSIPKDLVINRYPLLLKTQIIQDKKTQIFVVLSQGVDGVDEKTFSLRPGMVVPQEGKTAPDLVIPAE